MRRVVLGIITAVAMVTPGTATADPTSRPSSSPRTFFAPLELELPFLRPLRFSFSSDPVPGFESLRLGTYRTESVWLERENLSLRTFGHVAPSLELDCSLTCQPMLERVAGVEGRLGLGGVGRAIPATYLFLRGQSSHVAPLVPGTRGLQKSNLLSFGLGGLLDF